VLAIISLLTWRSCNRTVVERGRRRGDKGSIWRTHNNHHGGDGVAGSELQAVLLHALGDARGLEVTCGTGFVWQLRMRLQYSSLQILLFLDGEEHAR